MKLVTVLGARPQFIKAAAVSHAIATHNRSAARPIVETIVHTGQHYDHAMSGVFFSQLGVPAPTVNLNVGSGSHGEQTAAMMIGLEAFLADARPDMVLVYGDTNSTLAAAIVAAKLCLSQAHVEAGLRSRNMRMPEEINRIVADRLADLLFTGTVQAKANLMAEGMGDKVSEVGDVMWDCVRLYRRQALASANAPAGAYALATIHRAENVDDPLRLAGLLRGLRTLARELPVVLPLHPRTRARIEAAGDTAALGGLGVIAPVSYFEMMALEAAAALILTDSGGVQKEAFFHGVPCVTLRGETEWVETVQSGWNRLVGSDDGAIVVAARAMLAFDRTAARPDFYGDGHAADKIVAVLAR